ncbi:carbonic anhydrase [Vogesella fluminis]|uniref:Carbonic anhydrase n=1 Tax=Vogesella fluminis TaxID=1069161 RepID=A0ABQ3H944_9NEIS|nr:carbonic anhydrase [Vogesella fluminis]GHD74747.1 carbonic anhydrase [Vogesella fluminis]
MPLADPLLEGFRRFQQQYFSPENDLFAALRHGQRPVTLVIACCDSRVHPPALMGSQPGEMFVIRNVANLVPPHSPDNQHASVAAALEFAVLSLQVARIIVMGHAGCGGIRALMLRSTPQDSALTHWLNIAAPARELVYRHHAAEDEASRLRRCEQAGILVSLNNLLTYPWLADKVKAGEVTLDGWYFDLNDGTLWGLDAPSNQFIPLVCPLGQQ